METATSQYISPNIASQILGISAPLLRYRANAGLIRFARRTPMRFRVSDVLEYKSRIVMPVAGRRGRPRKLPLLLERLTQ